MKLKPLLYLLFVTILLPIWNIASSEPKFYEDDPVWTDPDNQPAPKPNSIEISQVYDFAENTFVRPRQNKEIPRAVNINTLGEVPDSSWFTNRIGRTPMTVEEVVRGPNQGEGPDMSAPWTITRAKSEGISPGFTIKDSRGDTYFIKFDPLRNPQLATSAEVICTKFFHAFGYNVAENYLAFLHPDMLRVSAEATFTDEDGQKRKMTLRDINGVLKKVPLMPDGTIQVIASKRVPGEPIGHFKYWGTRSDDANDVFPHQDRRELRGLRIFSAWLNHDDSRGINSLDLYAGGNDGGHVRHYLIDFGSTLGSGSVRIQGRRAGNEYMIEWGPIAKAGFSFGLWDRFWRSIPYPKYPAIGRYEGDVFQPPLWKPEYPNPAFDRMTDEDAFWAVRMVARFSDEMIRSIVKTGRIADPEAEKYLADTIIKRRDKIVRYYLGQMNTLDNFQVSEGLLMFEDAGVAAGISQVESHSYQWFRFDNETGRLAELGPAASSNNRSIPVPQETHDFLMLRLNPVSSVSGSQKKVDIFLRNRGEKVIVGIERE